MSKKSDIRAEWLEVSLDVYDGQLDADAKRDLFRRTCRSASARFTAKELEEAAASMREWLERHP